MYHYRIKTIEPKHILFLLTTLVFWFFTLFFYSIFLKLPSNENVLVTELFEIDPDGYMGNYASIYNDKYIYLEGGLYNDHLINLDAKTFINLTSENLEELDTELINFIEYSRKNRFYSSHSTEDQRLDSLDGKYYLTSRASCLTAFKGCGKNYKRIEFFNNDNSYIGKYVSEFHFNGFKGRSLINGRTWLSDNSYIIIEEQSDNSDLLKSDFLYSVKLIRFE